LGCGALLDETADDFALAHELSHTLGVGHDSDAAHPRGPVAEDGWDVLNLTEDDPLPRGPKISLPAVGNNYYSIMRATEFPNPIWVARGHYELMLDKLVQGGKDPSLLLVRGVVFRDGSAVLLPAYVADGTLETPPSGIYSVETVDATGGLLNKTSFD